MGRRGRAEFLLERLGLAPNCLGHYEAAATVCTGPPACTWANHCASYKGACRERGVDPAVERRMLGPREFISFVDDIRASSKIAVRPDRVAAKLDDLFAEFLLALSDALGFQIPDWSLTSESGEIYYLSRAIVSKRGRYTIGARTAGGLGVWFVHYSSGSKTKPTPNIRLRCDAEDLIGVSPPVEAAARRWEPAVTQSCVAVAVAPRRVPDVARAVARGLSAGVFHRMKLEEGSILFEKGAMKWGRKQ